MISQIPPPFKPSICMTAGKSSKSFDVATVLHEVKLAEGSELPTMIAPGTLPADLSNCDKSLVAKHIKISSS